MIDEELFVKVVHIVMQHDDLIKLLSQDFCERLEEKKRLKDLEEVGVECQ